MAQLDPGHIDMSCSFVGSDSCTSLMIHVRLLLRRSVFCSFFVFDVTSAFLMPELPSVAVSAIRLHQKRHVAPFVTLVPNMLLDDLISLTSSDCVANGIGTVPFTSRTSGPC